MTMEPADARSVGWIEAKLNDLAARRKPRLKDLREYCDPLPCGRLDQDRTICRRTPFNDICEPFAGGVVEPVNFVPNFDQRPLVMGLARLDAQLVQDFFDVAQLRFGIFMGNVTYM